jgi:hypothetical protein
MEGLGQGGMWNPQRSHTDRGWQRRSYFLKQLWFNLCEKIRLNLGSDARWAQSFCINAAPA